MESKILTSEKGLRYWHCFLASINRNSYCLLYSVQFFWTFTIWKSEVRTEDSYLTSRWLKKTQTRSCQIKSREGWMLCSVRPVYSLQPFTVESKKSYLLDYMFVLFIRTTIPKRMEKNDWYLFVKECFFSCRCAILAWEQQYSSPAMKIMCYKVQKVSPVRG